IAISSPKLYHVERNVFVNILIELQTSGIEVAILTSIESDQTEFLKSKGLFVKAISKLSLCSCVIDKAITWYGSINILGYAAEEDNIIKIEDFKLANELLNVIYDSKR